MNRLFALSESCGQAMETGLVGRQAEPQEIVTALEAAAPDLLPRQCSVPLQRFGVMGEPKQRRTARYFEALLHQNIVKFARFALQPVARAVGPWLIGQRVGADMQGRAGTRPRAQCLGDLPHDFGRAYSEAEPKAGEAIEFAERAQDYDRPIRTQRDRADGRIDIGERLVQDQPAAAFAQAGSDSGERVRTDDAAIGIVRVHDNSVTHALRQIAAVMQRDRVVACHPPRQIMLTIGRPHNGDRSRRRQPRQPLDQRLRSRRNCNPDIIGYPIGCARARNEKALVGPRGQALPDGERKFGRYRPWPRVDSRRQIKPLLRRAAMARYRLREIASMYHRHHMLTPQTTSARIRKVILAVAMCMAIGSKDKAFAAEPPRIASINLCTDQLLVTLADPAQVLGLSPYARDPVRSWDAAKAAQFPLLSGGAEDVLVLKPDVVVAGRFTKRATRELLKDKGLRVVEFDVARSLDDVKKHIRQMGELVQHPDRAASEISKLDAAIAHVREVASRKPYRVLAVSRRGWVSGSDSLITSLLRTVGLYNAASEMGNRTGGLASLEAIVSLKADFLLVSSNNDFVQDEGGAFLLHPALERFYPATKRIVIPEKLTVCGGLTLIDALERLASELERVSR